MYAIVTFFIPYYQKGLYGEIAVLFGLSRACHERIEKFPLQYRERETNDLITMSFITWFQWHTNQTIITIVDLNIYFDNGD